MIEILIKSVLGEPRYQDQIVYFSVPGEPLDADLAIDDKRRQAPNKAKAMAVIGDVKGKIAIILDDMVDTAGTLTEATYAIVDKGAKEIHACCAHPVLSGESVERLANSPLKTIVVSDTIPLNSKAAACDKIRVLSVADLIGEAIIRSHKGDSVTSLFV
ncbi:MAG: ribose-phosphate diphosphokinase, partial [Proteobacteria bacterium]|nr:ribose-phosphate diphosphokinase [Pseudomonadota bacterium]